MANFFSRATTSTISSRQPQHLPSGSSKPRKRTIWFQRCQEVGQILHGLIALALRSHQRTGKSAGQEKYRITKARKQRRDRRTEGAAVILIYDVTDCARLEQLATT